ncbi:DUF4153 domain-containing protein [Spirillospora sp. CA-294931]|uniref:DUF4153 domain-containing protein n=1 Tax=Spirillospora sp. CA-294931 TaxID=3240042 RepID=UPI003D8EC5C2
MSNPPNRPVPYGQPVWPPQPAPPPVPRRPVPPPPPPRDPTRLERLFLDWRAPGRPLSAGLLGGIAAAGLIGAGALGALVPEGFAGLNLLIAALAVTAVTLPVAWSSGRMVVRDGTRRRVNRTGLAFCSLALVLAGVASVRDAVWIVALAAALAVPIASYGVVGGRSWTQVLAGGGALGLASAQMGSWAGRGARETMTSGRDRTVPIVRTVLLALALLAVFGALFSTADAAFGDLAEGLLPEVSGGSVLWHVVAGIVTAWAALTFVYVTLAPPPLKVLTPDRPKAAPLWSWAVPIAALDLLFMAFCAVQASVLLASDKDALLKSTGLTYAEYARRGFFQLVVVTVLVLVVIAVAMRRAPMADARGRAVVRGLLGLLCALTLVVVSVALRRLYLYEETYGWTRLRLWVHAFELWLGLVIVLVAAAGVRWRASWLPRAVAASGAVALIALAAIDPDAFIAERNVARFEQTGKIDTGYLSGLSADAVPALDRLPEPHRSCALREIAARLDRSEPAVAANLARHRARVILDRRPDQRC